MNALMVNLFILAVLLISIWYLWFFEYRKYLLDDTRQRLFKIRDDLFYAAAVEGKIDVNSPLYGMTRNTINGTIRFAHEVSAVHYILTTFYGHKKIMNNPLMKEYKARMDKAVESVTDEQKEFISEVQSKMHLTVFNHIVRGSLVLRLLVYVLGFVFMLRNLRLEQALTSKKAKEKWSILDAEANYIAETKVC